MSSISQWLSQSSLPQSGYISASFAKNLFPFKAIYSQNNQMNPCPCGYLGDPSGRCRCSAEQIQRYRSKLSGPLLDRIDLHLHVAREATALHANPDSGTSSAQAAATVAAARQRQEQRQGGANAFLDLQQLRQHCSLSDDDQRWLESACERLGLSLRAAHRLLKVARTLADLDAVDAIQRSHLAEALQYRPSSPTA